MGKIFRIFGVVMFIAGIAALVLTGFLSFATYFPLLVIGAVLFVLGIKF